MIRCGKGKSSLLQNEQAQQSQTQDSPTQHSQIQNLKQVLKKDLKNHKKAGFTLVELVVTFALLGIFIVGCTTVISNGLVLFSRVKGSNYAHTVSDTLLDKIEGEIAGAQVGTSVKYTMTISPLSADGNSNAIAFYNRYGSPVVLRAPLAETDAYATNETLADGETATAYENVGYFVEHYRPLYNQNSSESDEIRAQATNWTFDSKVYMNYQITKLTFEPYKTDAGKYTNVIKVTLELKNRATGYTFAQSRYVECYNFENGQDVAKISEGEITSDEDYNDTTTPGEPVVPDPEPVPENQYTMKITYTDPQKVVHVQYIDIAGLESLYNKEANPKSYEAGTILRDGEDGAYYYTLNAYSVSEAVSWPSSSNDVQMQTTYVPLDTIATYPNVNKTVLNRDINKGEIVEVGKGYFYLCINPISKNGNNGNNKGDVPDASGTYNTTYWRLLVKGTASDNSVKMTVSGNESQQSVVDFFASGWKRIDVATKDDTVTLGNVVYTTFEVDGAKYVLVWEENGSVTLDNASIKATIINKETDVEDKNILIVEKDKASSNSIIQKYLSTYLGISPAIDSLQLVLNKDGTYTVNVTYKSK